MITPVTAWHTPELDPRGNRGAVGIENIDMRSRVLSLMPVDRIGTIVPPRIDPCTVMRRMRTFVITVQMRAALITRIQYSASKRQYLQIPNAAEAAIRPALRS